MSRRATAAFSLVELLVVISIIGVLMALLMPSLVKARDSALSIDCLNRCRGYWMSYLMAAEDNNGTFIKTGQYLAKDYFIASTSPDEHRCPSDDIPRTTISWCAKPYYPISYGVNGFLTGWVYNKEATGAVGWVGLMADWKPLRISRVKTPGHTIGFGEYTEKSAGVWHPDNNPNNKWYVNVSLYPGRYNPVESAWVKYDHMQGHNFTFIDGSGRYMTYFDLTNDGYATWHHDIYNLRYYNPSY